MRRFLEDDPVGNAFVFDRAFQMDPGADVVVDDVPPRAVLAVARPAWAHGDAGLGWHALDGAAAEAVAAALPSGPIFGHLADEFLVPLLQERAPDLDVGPAWLFSLAPKDFVDAQLHDVGPLRLEDVPEVAGIWSPDWDATEHVRERVEAGPSFAVYAAGRPVAWALTHFETDRVSAMGFLYVRPEMRGKGYARSVACALARDILGRGKVPIVHVDVDNVPSLALTESLGFRKVKRQVWAEGVLREPHDPEGRLL